MMKRSSLVLAAVGFAAGLLLSTTPSEAVHKGAGGLTCGQCHTMHNSQGRLSLNDNSATNDTSMILLRGNVTGRENIHNLCLQCHGQGGVQAEIVQNGSNVQAPKVYIKEAGRDSGPNGTPISGGDAFAEGDMFTKIGSGGDFSYTGEWTAGEFVKTIADGGSDCNSNNPSIGRGHSIGCKNVIPPGADSDVGIELSCTSCHDPHGNDIISPDPTINTFRNLRKQPIGGGGGRALDSDGPATVNGKSWIGGVTGRAPISGGSGNYNGLTTPGGNHIWPIFKDASNQNSYPAPSGIATGNTEGLSSWCAQCHDKWHEGKDPDGQVSQGLFNRMPIKSQYSNRQDWKRHPVDNPLTGDGTPFSSAKVDIIRYSHYSNNSVIPVGKKVPAAQADGNGNTYYADDNKDKVFCFSCHFVHGGPYYDNLRWNYQDSVEAGSQIGRAIESNIGCQQCHNR
ncbi:MAG: hypothetical protein ACE5FU_07945 [Nitrospinota bacterium]